MKNFAFALAALVVATGSGSALAQCSCGRAAQPARSVSTVQPTYRLAPTTQAPCCTVPLSGTGATTASGHQHGVIVPTTTTNPVAADPAKETKLTGTLMCGKCSLKATTKCSNVLQVKEGDKLVNYFLDDKGNGETYHEGVCGDGKIEGVAVSGTVSEKDGKKFIKPSKVDLPKK